MLCLYPTSTLFPYTTLFRSAVKKILKRAVELQGTSFRDYIDIEGRPGNFSPRLRVYQRTGEPCRLCGRTIRDRKSTRLNSSHQIISYAVFCLKKKNTSGRQIDAVVGVERGACVGHRSGKGGNAAGARAGAGPPAQVDAAGLHAVALLRAPGCA